MSVNAYFFNIQVKWKICYSGIYYWVVYWNIWAASSEKGAYGNLKNKLWGKFQLSITMKVFIDFALIPLKIKCYSILQKRPSLMLDISNCDVIYYVI